MTTGFAIQTILEIIAVLFGVYALLHEDKFVAFEDKMIKVIRRQVILYKRRKALEKRKQQGSANYNAPAARRQPQNAQARRTANAPRQYVA